MDVKSFITLGPDDGPDPDHVSAPDLDGDERSREDVGVVLLEGGFCHLKKTKR
jgi:hypothetical protein